MHFVGDKYPVSSWQHDSRHVISNLFSVIISLTVLLSLAIPFPVRAQEISLVPWPESVLVVAGKKHVIPESVQVSVPEIDTWKKHWLTCKDPLIRLTHGKHQFELTSARNGSLVVRNDDSLQPEEYSIRVLQHQIVIHASSLKGLCRATATLFQVIANAADGQIPCLVIRDSPKVAYRNLMIDMGRNPHSFELLKETIDLLWYYKVDSLQLHLTDDQRFAFPSTAFPKLWDGLITLDDFRELEEYAADRGVTIIPEFEVPGHSGKLRGIYPEVFGKTATELASSEKARSGIKTILEEMVDVFSSTPYVHIGGDEAFGVPEELQRELINNLHAWLKSKGKQTIVWEGPRPGEGKNKVNEEVIHINWRTINYPAGNMIADGYRVVNAAWDPLYLVDHYPRTNFTMTTPRHIYETLSLTQFKHVNPGIPTFLKPHRVAPTDQLIGFCMPWWEGREENFLAQVVPRLIPFAEVSWNSNIERDFDEYTKRLKKTESARRQMFYPVRITASDLAVDEDNVFHDKCEITLSLENDSTSSAKPTIRYTLDGSRPNSNSPLYEKPFLITGDTTIRAAAFAESARLAHETRANFSQVTPVENLALGKPVSSSVSSGAPFSIGRVTDGGTDNLDFYLGYPAEPKPVDITIDLEATKTVSSITVFAYSVNGSWEKYSVEVSIDGVSFEEVASRLEKPNTPGSSVEHKFVPRDVRYVRIRSHGNKGYVFDSFSKIIEVQIR